jgi:hypothetical protein
MTYQIINVATKEDLLLINEFVNSVKFNTKDDHIPLHDPLFSQDGVDFDITTYGDMTREVVSIFEKYTFAIQTAVSQINKIFYDSPILGKSYITRHGTGKNIPMQYGQDRPKNVFRSIVKWTDSCEGGIFKFKNYKIAKDLSAGDCIIFPENEEFMREFTTITEGSLYLSDFWNAPVGQSPYPGLKYEEIYWGNPRWENH